MNNWNRHYLVKRLRRLNPNESGDWQQMAQEINEEVRQPMLFTMSNKGIREWKWNVACDIPIELPSNKRFFANIGDWRMDFEDHQLQCSFGSDCRLPIGHCSLKLITTGFFLI
jgi:hypothetical protein